MTLATMKGVHAEYKVLFAQTMKESDENFILHYLKIHCK